MSNRVLIQYPIYKYPEPRSEDCLNDLLVHMLKKGYKGTAVDRPTGESMVTRIRNRCISRAIRRGGFDWIMHIDSDIVFPKDLVERLLNHNRDVIGAIYRTKNYSKIRLSAPPVDKPGVDYKDNKIDMKSGLVKMKYLSCGCMLVRMEVINKLVEKYPELQYYDDVTDEISYALYNPIIAEHRGKMRFLSEDWAFCHRIKECGYELWADTDIRIGHLMMAPLYVW